MNGTYVPVGPGNMSYLQQKAQLQNILTDTVMLLCRNSIPFRKQLSVEGLLGITVDDEAVILVNVKELIKSEEEKTIDPADIESPVPSEMLVRGSHGSGRRRKCAVTRRAIFNVENEGPAEDEAEFAESYFTKLNNNSVSESANVPYYMTNGFKEDDNDMPLNLVKTEPRKEPDDIPCPYPSKTSTSNLREKVLKSEPTYPTPITEDNYCDKNSKKVLGRAQSPPETMDTGPAKLDPSVLLSNIPQLKGLSNKECQMRRYGAYGYIINLGNEVMYSCNVCPKIFHNRVSLWRHGVRHKQNLIQAGQTQTKTTQWPCLVCGSRFSSDTAVQQHLVQQHGVTQDTLQSRQKTTPDVSKNVSSTLESTQRDMVNYHRSLGITSNSLSSYGVVSHIGQNKWYVCVICHQKFRNRASLWKHKTKHFANKDMKKSSDVIESSMTIQQLTGSHLDDQSLDGSSVDLDEEMQHNHSLTGNHDNETSGNHDNDTKEDDLEKDKFHKEEVTTDKNSAQCIPLTNSIPHEATETAGESGEELISEPQQKEPESEDAASEKSDAPNSPIDMDPESPTSRMSKKSSSALPSRPQLRSSSSAASHGYDCGECKMTFRDSVALWKHQFKHKAK